MGRVVVIAFTARKPLLSFIPVGYCDSTELRAVKLATDALVTMRPASNKYVRLVSRRCLNRLPVHGVHPSARA